MYLKKDYTWLQYTIMGVLVLMTVVSLVVWQAQSNKYESLKHKADNVSVPSEKKLNSQVTQDDVEKYENITRKKLDSFLRNNIEEGQYNYDNEGVNVVRAVFSLGGGKIISKDTSQKEAIKHYSEFDYDLSNVSAEETGSGFSIYANLKVSYDGKRVNEDYSLMRLDFDKDDKLVGGNLYGRP